MTPEPTHCYAINDQPHLKRKVKSSRRPAVKARCLHSVPQIGHKRGNRGMFCSTTPCAPQDSPVTSHKPWRYCPERSCQREPPPHLNRDLGSAQYSARAHKQYPSHCSDHMVHPFGYPGAELLRVIPRGMLGKHRAPCQSHEKGEKAVRSLR